VRKGLSKRDAPESPPSMSRAHRGRNSRENGSYQKTPRKEPDGDRREVSRRSFVIGSCAGLGSAWLLTNLPEILLAQQHVHQAALSASAPKLEFFSAEQAVEVDAIAAQIIPTDSTPGAREARVVYFIDRALATFAAGDRLAFVRGLAQLQSRVRRRFKKLEHFSALSSEQQIRILKSIEKTPFFDLVRTLTIFGMFANPTYGGNYEEIGWKLIGFESQFLFQSPFGYYDRDYVAGQ
jgi:Gluconate 2-dehydrogenase subunit 3